MNSSGPTCLINPNSPTLRVRCLVSLLLVSATHVHSASRVTYRKGLTTGRRVLISTESNYTDSQDTPLIQPTDKLHVSVQFSSVAQSCPTLCDPMNRSTPVLHKSGTHLAPLTHNHLGISTLPFRPLAITSGVQTAPSPRITLGETIPPL